MFMESIIDRTSSETGSEKVYSIKHKSVNYAKTNLSTNHLPL